MASMIVILGICAPGSAQAQGVTIGPLNQTATFSLSPTQNPITFLSNVTIDTTATSTADAVFGGVGTTWNVTNQGLLNSSFHGVSLSGAGSSLINSGTISTTNNLVTSAGVFLANGGTVTNQASGTISGVGGADGVEIDGAAGTVTNAGTITSTDTAGVFLKNNGTVTNQQTGKITGNFFGIVATGLPAGTVTNAGSITATDTTGIGVSGLISTLTNQAGGTISGGVNGVGVNLTANNATVTNEQGATISGGKFGISMNGSLFNSGTIFQTDTSTGGNAAVSLSNGGTINNQASGKINGALNGIFATGTAAPTTIINSGSITSKDALGAAVNGTVTTLTNRTGGTITNSNGVGISVTSNATITNETGATISGNTIGISMGSNASIINAGTIEATAANGRSVSFTGTGTNTLTLQTGSVLKGTAFGSTATAGAINNLVFEGSGATTSNFQNFNNLNVRASGTWTWNSTASGTFGQTTVESGTLAVDGSLTSPVVTVNALGVLAGHGAVTGTASVAGTVAPGAAAPFSTLTVNGNVDFTRSAIYRVNVNASARNDKLVTTGTATLNGSSVNVLAQNGTYQPSTQYNILHADGGLSGTFASVTTNLAFLTPSLTHGAKDVTLTLITSGGGGGGGGTTSGGTGGGTGNIFATVAQTRNQNAVANALDPNAVTNPVVLAMLNQTADGARRAFDALSGEVFGSVRNVQAGESQFARSAMLGRLRQASYLGYVGELGALAFGGPELAYAGDNVNAAYAADIRSAVPGKAPMHAGERSRDLTFWAQGLGGWGHTDGDGNAASVSGRFGGFLSGVDARFGETLRAGFVAGYLRSDLNADARSSSAGIDSVQLGAYAGGKLGALNVRGGASYSFDSIDVSRGIFFPGFTDQTKASFHGNVGQVFGEVGYGMALNNVAVEPLAGLAYVHVHDGSFLESGGAAALSGASTHENIGYSFLGFRAATVLPLANGTALVPRASVQWQYAFGDVTPVAGLAFQGMGTAFSVAGVPIARNTALIETGFDWRFSPRAKLGAFYQGELAAHAHTHAIKGGFTWNF